MVSYSRLTAAALDLLQRLGRGIYVAVAWSRDDRDQLVAALRAGLASGPLRPPTRGAGVNTGRLRRGSRSGRRSFASFEAGLDEANHPVHEFEEFGGARGSRQGLGFIAFVELTQAGDG